MNPVLFNGWPELFRIAVIGTAAYVALVAILRITGKRTLSKMSSYDFVVTVALGSTLGSTILSKDTALVEGLLALTLLVALQFGATWLSVRSPRFRTLIQAKPTLLIHRGEFQQAAMLYERVTEAEVLAAIRDQGFASVTDELAVVLEADGSLSVASSGASSVARRSSLRDVEQAGR